MKLATLLFSLLLPLASPAAAVGQGFSPINTNPAASLQSKRPLYTPSITGNVVGFRLAGVEPDGDPLYQVLLQTKLSPSHGTPRLHLIVDAYMENFKPDTTPILPDLLHPKQDAQNLGGFLDGKALLTDDAGDVLYIGTFLAEAFLDNTNHAVSTLAGTGAARGSTASLKGSFTLKKDASLRGNMQGQIVLPPSALTQISQHRGAAMRPIKQIISGVTVKPRPMLGRSTTGSSNAPLHTGYGRTSSQPASHPQRSLSPLSIVAGIGAILSFLMAGSLWWWQRRSDRREVKA